MRAPTGWSPTALQQHQHQHHCGTARLVDSGVVNRTAGRMLHTTLPARSSGSRCRSFSTYASGVESKIKALSRIRNLSRGKIMLPHKSRSERGSIDVPSVTTANQVCGDSYTAYTAQRAHPPAVSSPGQPCEAAEVGQVRLRDVGFGVHNQEAADVDHQGHQLAVEAWALPSTVSHRQPQ